MPRLLSNPRHTIGILNPKGHELGIPLGLEARSRATALLSSRISVKKKRFPVPAVSIIQREPLVPAAFFFFSALILCFAW